MALGHPRGAVPFAGRVFRFHAVNGGRDPRTGERVGPPPQFIRAHTLDTILKEYPGYTLRTLLEEDAYELLQIQAILDPDVGKVRD